MTISFNLSFLFSYTLFPFFLFLVLLSEPGGGGLPSVSLFEGTSLKVLYISTYDWIS